MAEEIFDVCDEQDNVIGQSPRSEVHAKNLLHRAVHLWIWNSSGELLLQLRSETKDQYPGCYTSSASGHVDVGEDYETAAVRELWEELQLRGDLTQGTKLPASADTAFEHTMLYHLQTDASPVPDPSEIAELHYFSTAAISEMLDRDPERFTPPFRVLFADWLARSAEICR
ncbi:NUDIX hydrolase [Planctomicrobium sp. SH661]|uniref:NUDIX hydrolase n=1 Tax=Planctomicrobium sp. SH661 TaxID=3448124 RepID=UPI003F5B87C1